MASAFATKFAELLARPGSQNIMAIFEKVERGTATEIELTEYRSFMDQFRQWKLSKKTNRSQGSISAAA